MRIKWTVIGIEFISLYIFWILLSGRFQLKYLVIGIFASGIVTYFTSDLLYKYQGKKAVIPPVGFIFFSMIRLVAYAVWLVWVIIKANIQIAAIILNPKMPIDPGVMEFKTRLRKRISLVTLGNSITLTPGTFTVDIRSSTYMIHLLLPKAVKDLESGLMQNKVGEVFVDNKDPSPACKWSYFSGEMESTKEIKE